MLGVQPKAVKLGERPVVKTALDVEITENTVINTPVVLVKDHIRKLLLHVNVDTYLHVTPRHLLVTADPNESVRDAILLLKTNNLIIAPVAYEEDHHLVGLLDFAAIVGGLVATIRRRAPAFLYPQAQPHREHLQKQAAKLPAAYTEFNTTPVSYLSIRSRALVPFVRHNNTHTTFLHIAQRMAEGNEYVTVLSVTGSSMGIISQRDFLDYLSKHPSLALLTGRVLKDEFVRSVMRPHHSATPNVSVLQAFNMMVEEGARSLAITDAQGLFVGALEYECVKAITEVEQLLMPVEKFAVFEKCVSHKEGEERPVRSRSHYDVIRSDSNLEECVEKMLLLHTHHMFVVDPMSGKPVGMISLTDIIALIIA